MLTTIMHNPYTAPILSQTLPAMTLDQCNQQRLAPACTCVHAYMCSGLLRLLHSGCSITLGYENLLVRLLRLPKQIIQGAYTIAGAGVSEDVMGGRSPKRGGAQASVQVRMQLDFPQLLTEAKQVLRDVQLWSRHHDRTSC